MKKYLIVIMLFFLCLSVYSQSYAIRDWDHIGRREMNVARSLNTKFNQVWYDYNGFIKCDSIIGNINKPYLGEYPHISHYVFDSYNDACADYNWGCILSCIGAGLFASGMIMTAHNFNVANGGKGKSVNQTAATTLGVIGGLSVGVGITITLVARCDKRSCNLSAYKEYNYNIK